MKIEDIFNTDIKSELIEVNYKEFTASFAIEVIEDFKVVYGKQALEKMKSILDNNIVEKLK